MRNSITGAATFKFSSLLLAFLAAAMLTAAWLAFPGPASAEDTVLSVDDAQAAVNQSILSLEEAQSELDKISEEYKTIDEDIQSMQAEIDATAKKVMEAQARMLQGRESLGNTVRQEYRTSTISMFVQLVLGSNTIQEMTKGAQCIEQIMQHYSDEVIEQKKIKAEFDRIASDLNDKKNEQEEMLSELDKKKQEAQAVVAKASSSLNANSARLEALRAQAADLQRQQQLVSQSVSGPAPVQQTEYVEDTSGVAPAESAEGIDTSTEGWRVGEASAYGGSSDASTGAVATSATGDIVDDYSMGVAVPMSWDNFRSYYGRTIEIVYNGQVVYATINDCGGMDGVKRHLDLQPGVFKAFGFGSCQAWGVRNVEYRIL